MHVLAFTIQKRGLGTAGGVTGAYHGLPNPKASNAAFIGSARDASRIEHLQTEALYFLHQFW